MKGRVPRMEHSFVGPRYTVGIEEELMILDAGTLDLASGIAAVLGEAAPEESLGTIQPEFLESVLEIATSPCSDVPTAHRRLASLRTAARERAERHGFRIGASGTHPFARWEDQRVVAHDRYRGLVRSLGFVARQELVFGMHVHVGMADPEETVQVANAIRSHIPLLIALAGNSPLWRGAPTGLMSSRVPIFRAFPRVGLPPRFAGWEDFAARVETMRACGMIEDYTYLWYDVRPHPRLGTIEIRAMDSQTRIEHTVALAALVVSLVHMLVEDYRGGAIAVQAPWEILDENRWLAARHGVFADLFDQPSGTSRPARELAAELLEELAAHAAALGCERELEGIEDLLRGGTGAQRQLMVYEANQDLRELVAEIADVAA